MAKPTDRIYKVWVQIESQNAEGTQIENESEPHLLAEFDTLKEAQDHLDGIGLDHDLPEELAGEADSRLIDTAAPDLLAACRLMYQAWEALIPCLKNNVVQDYNLVLNAAPSACKKAIAKATGQKDIK